MPRAYGAACAPAVGQGRVVDPDHGSPVRVSKAATFMTPMPAAAILRR